MPLRSNYDAAAGEHEKKKCSGVQVCIDRRFPEPSIEKDRVMCNLLLHPCATYPTKKKKKTFFFVALFVVVFLFFFVDSFYN